MKATMMSLPKMLIVLLFWAYFMKPLKSTALEVYLKIRF